MDNLTWIEFWRNVECDLYGFEDAIFNDHFYGLEPVKTTRKEFFDHIEEIKKRLDIKEGDSIFEIGCGCGIILYPFYEKGHKVGGIDLSESYLDISTKLMPRGNFLTGEALNLMDYPAYDFVFSCACAIYFPDHSYFEKVVEKAFKKAEKGVYFAQLNDGIKKDIYYRINAEAEEETEWHEFMASGDNRYIKSLNNHYENADRLFFTDEMMFEIGKKINADVKIFPQALPNRAREYRFDVLFSK